MKSLPKKIVLGVIDGICNLKCPMCLVNSEPDKMRLKSIKGKMNLEYACKIYDEAAEHNIPLSPHFWSEPLMIPDLERHLYELKRRGIFVSMDSNGLLLNQKIAKKIIELEVDSFFFSVDAYSSNTYFKMRGIDKLSKVHKNILLLLQERKEKLKPRIGVSFVETPTNQHEIDQFVNFWKNRVDVVRVNSLCDKNNRQLFGKNIINNAKRSACNSLFEIMVINHKGDVVLCCMDEWNEYILGNVFDTGLLNVWNNEKFKKIRNSHKKQNFSYVQKCSDCEIWKNFIPYKEKILEDMLIRSNGATTYFNRLSKLENWSQYKYGN